MSDPKLSERVDETSEELNALCHEIAEGIRANCFEHIDKWIRECDRLRSHISLRDRVIQSWKDRGERFEQQFYEKEREVERLRGEVRALREELRQREHLYREEVERGNGWQRMVLDTDRRIAAAVEAAVSARDDVVCAHIEAQLQNDMTEETARTLRSVIRFARSRTPEPTAPRLDALLADEQRAVARVAFLALLDGDVQDAISELRKLFPNEEISRQVAATLYGEPDIDGNARVPAHGEGSDDETCTECSRPGRDHGADDACPAAPAEEPAGVLLLPGEPAPAEPRDPREQPVTLGMLWDAIDIARDSYPRGSEARGALVSLRAALAHHEALARRLENGSHE